MKKSILIPLLSAITAFPLLAQGEVQLEPSGDTGEHDLFGAAVAMTGGTLVIGGVGADSATIPDSGAAFVFERSGNGWLQTARLMASDARTRDEFGVNVGISEDEDTIAVAADQATPSAAPSNFQAGAVYVFTRVNGEWIQEAELSSPTQSRSGAFGFWGMAISGNMIAVGDAGGPTNGFTPMVDVFTRTDNGWTLTATVGIPDDFEFFPRAVSMSGNTLVVTGLNSSISSAGVAYVFALQDGTWIRQAVLTVNDDFFPGSFGTSVSTDGNLIAVGAAFAPGATQLSGAVYVFGRNDGGWAQVAKLVASDGTDGDSFGQAVSVFGSAIAAGAPGHNLDGAVYLFRSQGDRFSQISQLTASDAVPGGSFGDAVALHDDAALIGALGQHPQIDNGQGYPGGEAYVDRIDR